MNFAIAEIVNIITHWAWYDRDTRRFVTRCSTKPVTLNTDTQDELVSKITNLIGSDSKRIPMEIRPDSKAFGLVQDIVKNDPKENTHFVKSSEEAVRLLTTAQAGATTKSGVLIVAHVLDATHQNMVLFIKGEFDKAIYPRPNQDGSATLELLEDLLVSSSRLYKIGAFLETGKGWVCVLHDDMVKGQDKGKAAQFFYDTFLSLSFQEEDKDLVLKFFNYTKVFIHAHYSEREEVDVRNALILYMLASSASVISAEEFADIYMSADKKDAYMKFMSHKHFPHRRFHKDLARVKSLLKSNTVRFHSGIEISVPPNVFKTDFAILDRNDVRSSMDENEEWTYVAIKGSIGS